MSNDGGPELGSGGFFGQYGGGPGGQGGYGDYGPRGPYGAWPGCGCGTVIMILGVLVVVCGGFLSMLEGMFRRMPY